MKPINKGSIVDFRKFASQLVAWHLKDAPVDRIVDRAEWETGFMSKHLDGRLDESRQLEFLEQLLDAIELFAKRNDGSGFGRFLNAWKERGARLSQKDMIDVWLDSYTAQLK